VLVQFRGCSHLVARDVANGVLYLVAKGRDGDEENPATVVDCDFGTDDLVRTGQPPQNLLTPTQCEVSMFGINMDYGSAGRSYRRQRAVPGWPPQR
jgi:hypothetical protein